MACREGTTILPQYTCKASCHKHVSLLSPSCPSNQFVFQVFLDNPELRCIKFVYLMGQYEKYIVCFVSLKSKLVTAGDFIEAL